MHACSGEGFALLCIHLTCILCVGKQLHLVHSQVKPGAIYQVVPFSISKLAISVNHAVCVLSWNDEESTLVEECSYQNNILSLFLKTKGDFILVSYEYHIVERKKKCGFLVKVIDRSLHVHLIHGIGSSYTPIDRW